VPHSTGKDADLQACGLRDLFLAARRRCWPNVKRVARPSPTRVRPAGNNLGRSPCAAWSADRIRSHPIGAQKTCCRLLQLAAPASSSATRSTCSSEGASLGSPVDLCDCLSLALHRQANPARHTHTHKPAATCKGGPLSCTGPFYDFTPASIKSSPLSAVNPLRTRISNPISHLIDNKPTTATTTTTTHLARLLCCARPACESHTHSRGVCARPRLGPKHGPGCLQLACMRLSPARACAGALRQVSSARVGISRLNTKMDSGRAGRASPTPGRPGLRTERVSSVHFGGGAAAAGATNEVSE
jgi:hypothetical protein